jgi:hypothetical protein
VVAREPKTAISASKEGLDMDNIIKIEEANAIIKSDF